jgi:hypothetical protein
MSLIALIGEPQFTEIVKASFSADKRDVLTVLLIDRLLAHPHVSSGNAA